MSNAQQLALIKAPRRERKISIDDWLCEREIESIEWDRSKHGSNGDQFERVTCDFPETLMPDRSRRALHRVKDCEYARARSALVPEAERIAAESIGDTRGITNGSRFTREFCRQMEKLAANLSL